MKYSILFTAVSLSLSQLVQGIPAKRDSVSDADVLNFALTLEHLETTYYEQALAKYTAEDFSSAGFPSWVRNRYMEIAAHEKTHVDFLTTALTSAGAKPVAACQYNFPDTDAKSFVAVSEVLESVGSSAYSGAAALLSNKDYLTAAASVLSVEARHAAWINSASLKMNPWSTAFEIPLGPNLVFTLASGFIKSCPSSNTPLPFKAFPSLSVPSSARPGQHVTLTFDASSSGKQLYAAFIVGTGTVFVKIDGNKGVQVPDGLIGTVYVVVTGDGASVDDASVVAGPAVLMFGFNSEGNLIA